MSFPATRWSLIERAAGEHDPAARVALDELLRAYAPALTAFLVAHMKLRQHDAEDVVQGFVAVKLLQSTGGMLQRADAARGRFRGFLMHALKRFAIDYLRAQQRQRRGGGATHEPLTEDIETPAGEDPAERFDRAWAAAVVQETLRRMYAECERDGDHVRWRIFEARIVLPIADGFAPPSHDDLAARHRLESSEKSANLLITARRQFQRVFAEVVQTYESSDHVEDEMTELWRIFTRHGA